MNSNSNVADLYTTVIAARQGPPPLVINVVSSPKTMEFVGGVPASSTRTDSYILFTALPQELQERVKVAVQALQSSI